MKVALTLLQIINVNANYYDGGWEYPDNGNYSLSFDGVDDHAVMNLIDKADNSLNSNGMV